MHLTSLWRVLGTCLVVVFSFPSMSIAAEDVANVQLPTVSDAIPVTATSRPFLGAKEAMEEVGYIEEEFFLSGDANVYDWASTDHTVKVVAGPTNYVTRILVRRPKDPADFSGNVEVMILNASMGLDFGGPIDSQRMAQQGDAWVGITSKAIAASALKTFDPTRYEPLNWANPAEPSSQCKYPSIIPIYMGGGKILFYVMAMLGSNSSSTETEDGLVWDMLGQLGLLLKSEHREKLLPGFKEPTLYMTGVSQSSIYIRTWLAAFHNRYRTPDGEPVYDGYLSVVGPALVRINQCSEDVTLDDPRQTLVPPDVPFISLSSEGEMWQGKHTHQPDTFTAKGGIVTYEVAGGSHQAYEIPGIPPDTTGRASPEDLARAGASMPNLSGIGKLLRLGADANDFVWAPLERGAYHNLQTWVVEGIRPPQALAIKLNSELEIMRDENGNALGGVRMPYIDVPTAAFRGYLSEGGIGGIMGTRKPLSPEIISKLYPDHATYVARFSKATDRLVSQRWISADDAEAMKKAAKEMELPE